MLKYCNGNYQEKWACERVMETGQGRYCNTVKKIIRITQEF
ncbi:MAG: hypothetical protein WCF93_05805 [Candidatus Moraniibacteriota bacterium]